MLSTLLIALLVLGSATPVEIAPDEVIKAYTAGDEVDACETVVLVPGLTGCAYGFRHLAAELVAAGCRVVVIEPLGVGASDRPADADYSLTAQADRLAFVIEREQAGSCLVVAHGVAGSMALRLALRRPELVLAVVSIEGGPDENSLTPTVERTLGLVSFAAKLGAKRLIRNRFKSSLEAASGDCSWINGTTVRRYFQGAGRDLSATVTVLRAMAKAQEPESLHANLPRITCPVVLLLGTAEHEGSPAPEAVALMQSSLPDFRVQNVPGAGHYIFEEQPQAVVRAVLEVARECRAASVSGLIETAAVQTAANAANSNGGASCAQ